MNKHESYLEDFRITLDFKLGYNPNPRYRSQTELADKVQLQIAILHDQLKNIMQFISNIKYTMIKKQKRHL